MIANVPGPGFVNLLMDSLLSPEVNISPGSVGGVRVELAEPESKPVRVVRLVASHPKLNTPAEILKPDNRVFGTLMGHNSARHQ